MTANAWRIAWIAGGLLGLLGLWLGGSMLVRADAVDEAKPADGSFSAFVLFDPKDPNWKVQVREALVEAGDKSPDAAIDQLTARLEEFSRTISLQGKYASSEFPIPDFLLDSSPGYQTSSYVGCGVNGRGNALITAQGPANTYIQWTGLKLDPLFVYAGTPIYQYCSNDQCLGYTAHQSLTHFSHTVTFTSDQVGWITDQWCS